MSGCKRRLLEERKSEEIHVIHQTRVQIEKDSAAGGQVNSLICKKLWATLMFVIPNYTMDKEPQLSSRRKALKTMGYVSVGVLGGGGALAETVQNFAKWTKEVLEKKQSVESQRSTTRSLLNAVAAVAGGSVGWAIASDNTEEQINATDDSLPEDDNLRAV